MIITYSKTRHSINNSLTKLIIHKIIYNHAYYLTNLGIKIHHVKHHELNDRSWSRWFTSLFTIFSMFNKLNQEILVTIYVFIIWFSKFCFSIVFTIFWYLNKVMWLCRTDPELKVHIRAKIDISVSTPGHQCRNTEHRSENKILGWIRL